MAHGERWREEVNLLKTESFRIPESFRHEQKIWLNRSGSLANAALPSRIKRGYEAYAYKQLAVYQRLEDSATAELQTVQKKVVPIVGLFGINPFG